MSLAHLRSAETSLLQIPALLPADNNLPGSSPERWGMTYPWEEGLNPHVPRVETQQSHPVVTELISVGLFRSAGASRIEGRRSRAHPAGKGPPCHGNSASSRQMDWAKHSSQMAPDFLPWVPVLLIEKGRCLAENWMIFRSFFGDDSFWSPFPLTARQVGFPGFPTGARWPKSLWGTIWGLSIMFTVPSSVLHSEYCQAQHSPWWIPSSPHSQTGPSRVSWWECKLHDLPEPLQNAMSTLLCPRTPPWWRQVPSAHTSWEHWLSHYRSQKKLQAKPSLQ